LLDITGERRFRVRLPRAGEMYFPLDRTTRSPLTLRDYSKVQTARNRNRIQ
jgi:hypothetical protein